MVINNAECRRKYDYLLFYKLHQAVFSVLLRAHAHKLTMIGLEEWRACVGAWDAVKGRWFVRWPFACSSQPMIDIGGIILMNI